ncbi:MAG: ribosome recycling factor [Pseudomonadota bacterium]
MAELDMKDLERRMDGAIEVLKEDFQGLRTGRASTGLVDHIQVEAYGAYMPLNQVGTVGVPEARLLTVQVWDKSMVNPVQKAISNAGLGLNPQPDGQLIRIPLPDLTEERRVELAKIAGKYSEQARISIRNVRQDGMQTVKKLKNDGDISEDDQKIYEDKVQKLTDRMIKTVDEMYEHKEKEIKQV